ncbi:MAG: bacterioferritin-associated ferredoxin [Mycobacterium sp.]|jgi:bacterioferritin-associated ferredoxin|nr:bacterioferritin-associated ferredoxin [Mycobacterium sp.]
MFVCLCTGATSHMVADVVACGARTCNEVARACGAGSDCGRCRRTVRAIIAATNGEDPDRALDERLELAESH